VKIEARSYRSWLIGDNGGTAALLDDALAISAR
jgi:hypothetical protein